MVLSTVNNNNDLTHFEKHIIVSTAGTTTIELLAENTPLSRIKLKKAMINGAVWLENNTGIHRVRRAKKSLDKGDRVHLYYDEAIQHESPEAAVLVSDEKDYSIWNKPYGMYSQGSKWGDHCTIYRWTETHLQPQRPAFLVHRIDRAANGLIIIAHSKSITSAFTEMFKKRQINKRYRARVEGSTEQLQLPMTITRPIDNKPATTIITHVNSKAETTLLTLEIESGRKHQIRKHLSEIGLPIVGDRLYGSGLSQENLQLQAYSLEFSCPLTGEYKSYTIE